MTGVNGTLLPPVNPKVGKRAVKSGAFSFPDFVNPLPQEVTDTEDIQKLHARYNLVPYSGTTTESGDSLRDFFSSMAYLSPTHGSCIQSKKRYSLGKIEVVNRQDDDFELGQDREVGNDLARLFVDFLKSIDFGQKLRALACEFHEDFEETGDQWLEIIESRSLGEVKYACRRHAPSNVKYIASKKGEQRYAAISPAWTFDYLERYPPAVVPLFPAFMDMEDGTSRTIIHHKNGKNDWYGRPPAFSSWEYMYREFQDASYLVKVTHSNFTGQLILEVEDDNPELTEEEARKQGYRSEADRMQKNFSNEADDPQTILYMVRPSGSRPAFVKQIEPNTSHEYYQTNGEVSAAKIREAHSWPRKLMDSTEASGLSTNTFIDVLRSTLPIIADVQESAIGIINKAIRAIVEMSGRMEFENLGLKFKSPYQEILDQTDDNSSGGSGTAQSGGQ